MPSSSKVFVAPFLGGLNTEISSIENALVNTSDELNCTIWRKKVRGRRFGMNVERDGEYLETPKGSVYSDYLWKNVSKTSTDFIVKQIDKILYFYQATNKPFSINRIPQTVDLTNYITEEGRFYQYPLGYSSGNGNVLIVSKYMKPLTISYDFTSNTFTVKEIDLKYRDITGIEDGTGIEETPTVLSDEHKYNLLNQGWSLQQITKFHTDKQKYPSNNLQWFIGKDNSGNLDTEKLLKTYFGNTKAPRGHFILNYFNKDRSAQSGITGGKGRKVSYSYSNTWIRNREFRFVPISDSTIVFPNSEGTSKSCTITVSRLRTKVAKRADGQYVGKVVYTLSGLKADGTWVVVNEETIKHNTSSETAPTIIVLTYPTNAVKYSQYKLNLNTIDSNGDKTNFASSITFSAELSIAEDGDPFQVEQSLDRITDIAYMSGKYFYLINDTVLFSQTITEDNQGFDKCYQDADPTSEEISDLLPTDGGLVKFDTMGEGMALKTFNRGVLIFGRDTVQGIISPSDGRFTATAYDVVELSAAGLAGSKSVVTVADSVFYWSPLGIFRIGVNQNTGNTLVAENISLTRIQSFYNDIQDFSKQFCKAAFDYSNNCIYWYYPTDENNLQKLDSVLVYDLNYDAFTPFKISEDAYVVSVFDTLNSSLIEPTSYVKSQEETIISNGEYVTANEETNDYNRYVAVQHGIVNKDGHVSFGDYNNRNFLDWDTVGFDSYLVSAPITSSGKFLFSGSMIANTFDKRQVPQLETIFERTEEGKLMRNTYISPSGAYIRVRWGWSLKEQSNRWDIQQNGYIPQKDFLNDAIVVSKMYVKGRGRSFQVEVRNDKEKDFRLVGMNITMRSK